jgi:hypothetical protein
MQSSRHLEGAIVVVTSVLSMAFLALSSCASHPDKIQMEYVSPYKYEDYNCEKIGNELERVSRSLNELYRSLEAEAVADKRQMAGGMFFIVPLLWLEGGDGVDAAEYSHLRGEFMALKDVAIKKQCDPKIIPPDPKDQVKE